MRVIFAPYYDSNPYQQALREALSAQGATVEPAREGLFAPLLRSYFGGRDTDVLHLHWLHEYFYAPSRPLFYVRATLFFVELLVLRVLGVRVVWTLHNLTSHEFPYPATETRLKRLFVRHCCDAVITHCEEAVDQAVEAYGLSESARERMHVVPHGHYFDAYETTGDRAEARAELGLAADKTVLLYFGMIRPYKNVPTLIETFRRVAGPDDVLLVAGNPQTEELRRAVSRATADDDRVHTRLEYIPESDVPTYMLAADAVVLPFRDTLTSGSSVLAMSFGRAFISPRLGCLPELVGSDGGAVLYDPDDPDGLASALRSVASLDLDAMGASNRERIAAYDWAGVADRTAAVYRDVCGTDATAS